MKISIPKELELGAFKFRVLFDRHLLDDDHTAVLMPRRERLAVDPTLTDSLKLEAFLHEVEHWICHIWGIEASEENITRLGQGLAEFFVRNFNLEFDWSNIEEVE